MALTEQKLKAIDLTINGETISNIAKILGCSRTSIYTWASQPEYSAELNRRVQEIKTQGEQQINKDLGLYISELQKIALTDKSPKVRSDTLQYLVDRVLGRTTAKIADVTDDKDTGKLDADVLADELEVFRRKVSDGEKKEEA